MTNETLVSAEMKNGNIKQLDKIATVLLFEENGENLKKMFFTKLRECFLQFRERRNERTCVILLKFCEYRFSALRKLLLEYSAIQTIREKQRGETEKTVL